MLENEVLRKAEQLRPRKVGVLGKVDSILEETQLDAPYQPGSSNGVRPTRGCPNATECEACGGIEYLSREFCRCGHYLRGQLEDEYLSWVRRLEHEVEEISTDYLQKQKKLKKGLMLTILLLTPPIAVQVTSPDLLGLFAYLWILAGLVVVCILAFIEARLARPTNDASEFLQNSSLQVYLEHRNLILNSSPDASG